MTNFHNYLNDVFFRFWPIFVISSKMHNENIFFIWGLFWRIFSSAFFSFSFSPQISKNSVSVKSLLWKRLSYSLLLNALVIKSPKILFLLNLCCGNASVIPLLWLICTSPKIISLFYLCCENASVIPVIMPRKKSPKNPDYVLTFLLPLILLYRPQELSEVIVI